MDYVLIKGSFHVVGFSPDGDSVAFRADDPSLWDRLVAADGGKLVAAPKARAVAVSGTAALPVSANLQRFRDTLAKNAGCAQLRLQGIDAPETHFPPSEGSPASVVRAKPVDEFRQPGDFGARAATALLAALGVTNPLWKKVFNGQYLASATVTPVGGSGPGATVRKKFADAIPGYIVTRDVEANGRPVAWVFLGDPAVPDGSTLTPDDLAPRVPSSVNHVMLASGLAYPYFYTSMENVLTKQLSASVDLAVAAASTAKNLWSVDRSTKGVALQDITTIVHRDGVTPDGALIWPYLFRKVLKYWYLTTPSVATTTVDISNLLVNANPTVTVDGDHVKLDSVVSVAGGTLRLIRAPKDIVFPA